MCSVLLKLVYCLSQSDPLKKRRTEDAVIAFTWYHYTQIDSNNPEWLLRLPMTKVCVCMHNALLSERTYLLLACICV